MTRKDKDPISKFNEWQEHQYNSGYWVNRFPPFFPPKRTKGYWIFGLIELFLLLPPFFLASYAYIFVEKNPNYLLLIGLLGVSNVMVAMRAIKLRPLKHKVTQDEQDEIRKKENKERKKKLPKRPKNYK